MNIKGNIIRQTNPDIDEQDQLTPVDYIAQLEALIKNNPGYTINPDSSIYKKALNQYKGLVKGLTTRPPVPGWVCGADRIDQDISPNKIVTPENSNVVGGPILLSAPTLSFFNSSNYRPDLCLDDKSLPSNDIYKFCNFNNIDIIYPIGEDVILPPVVPPLSGVPMTTLPNVGWFAGPVNFWWYTASQDSIDVFVKYLKDSGSLGPIIESRVLRDYPEVRIPSEAQLIAGVEKLINSCIKYNSWIWIIDCNWNVSYKMWSLDRLKEFSNKLITLGRLHNRVIFQPSSEPGSTKRGGSQYSKARQLYDYYTTQWNGLLAWNDNNIPDTAKINDVHVCTLNELARSIPGKINVTNVDCGRTLEDLHDGNLRGNRANTSKLVGHARRAWNAGQIFNWYEYWHQSPDYRSYDALAAAWAPFRERYPN